MDAVIRRITGTGRLDEALRGGVVAIGNFDGVHRGHQAVLERALDEAARRGVPALVLTFEPHPRMVFRPDVPLFILTPPPMKAQPPVGARLFGHGGAAFYARIRGTLGGRLRDRHPGGAARHQPCGDRLRLPFRQEPARRAGLPDGQRRKAWFRRDAGRRLSRRGRGDRLVEPHPLAARGGRRCRRPPACSAIASRSRPR